MFGAKPLALALAILVSGCTVPAAPPGESTSPTVGTSDATRGPGIREGEPYPGLLPLPGCSGTGTVRFQNSPMRSEDFPFLLPYGGVVGGHVTPIDHMYFATPWGSRRDAFEVRAIADGVVSVLQPRDQNVEQNKPKLREWRMEIAHTCTFESYFDLITWLEPSLYAKWNESDHGRDWKGVPVKAGQLVGRIGAQTLDFGVYDYGTNLTGFIVPAHYSEPWKIHTVDPFPYFDEPARSMLLSKMLRQAEPRAGKIDYDIDGRMVGNWFGLGTGGYGDGGHRWDYWDGHFSFVYDSLDPTQIRFSIGNWSNQPGQFGVVGNAPDPATVSMANGMIKIELARYSYFAHNRPEANGLGGGPNPLRPGDDVYAKNNEGAEGTALLEMVGPRLLKLEVFPAKTASQVSGFTAAARMYER